MKILYDNEVLNSTITVSSEISGYEISPALKDQRLSKTGRLDGILSENIDFDFGSSESIDSICIGNGNITSTAIIGLGSQLSSTFNYVQADTGLDYNLTDSTGMAALNNTDIAIIDSGNDILVTYRTDYNSWVQVGNSLPVTGMQNPAITALSSTRVAMVDGGNDELRAYDWDGTDWSLVGSGLSISGSLVLPNITALNSTDIAFADSILFGGTLRTYRFNGSTWAIVGSAFALGTLSYVYIAALDSDSVALIDRGSNGLKKYDFNGSVWAQDGSTFAITFVATDVIATSSTTVLVTDYDNQLFKEYTFSGSTWTQTNSVSLSLSQFTTIELLTPNIVVKWDVGIAPLTNELMLISPAFKIFSGSNLYENVFYCLFSETTSRYWSIFIEDENNADAYIEVTNVFLSSQLTMPGMELGQRIFKNTNSVARKSESGQLFGIKKTTLKFAEFSFREVSNADKVLFTTFLDFVDITECFYLLVWENNLDVQSPIYCALVELPNIARSVFFGLLWDFAMQIEECK